MRTPPVVRIPVPRFQQNSSILNIGLKNYSAIPNPGHTLQFRILELGELSRELGGHCRNIAYARCGKITMMRLPDSEKC